MAKVNADKFIDLVRRCNLVNEEDLNGALAHVQRTRPNRDPDDADAVADGLIECGVLTRWHCDKLLEGRHKGFFLGNYKLLDHLGSGGMSSVYLAEHVHMARRVAIKVLPQNRVDDSSYLARFYREARAAAALDHPNIVRAYDVASEGNVHYLVMEYVDGRDMQQIVRRDGPLPYDLAAEYTRQAALGLTHAHEVGLIHRDIKPANLLVDLRGTVRVLDLGLARFSDDNKASLTVAHDENVLGTADYLSPEQALNSHEVDARSDIYSLGCTLYFLLTGHPPFPHGTLTQRLLKHQSEAPASILLDRPDAPAELIAICDQLMAKSPDRRPQSANEAANLLEDWLRLRSQPTPRARVDERVAIAARSSTSLESPSPDAQNTPPSKPDALAARVQPLTERGGASSLVDTSDDLARPTIKGTGSARPTTSRQSAAGNRPVTDPRQSGGDPGARDPGARDPGGSDPDGSGKPKPRKLPVAKSLDETSQFAIQVDGPTHLRVLGRTGRRSADSDLKRRGATPRWLVLTLTAAGIVGALTLIALFIVNYGS